MAKGAKYESIKIELKLTMLEQKKELLKENVQDEFNRREYLLGRSEKLISVSTFLTPFYLAIILKRNLFDNFLIIKALFCISYIIGSGEIIKIFWKYYHVLNIKKFKYADYILFSEYINHIENAVEGFTKKNDNVFKLVNVTKIKIFESLCENYIDCIENNSNYNEELNLSNIYIFKSLTKFLILFIASFIFIFIFEILKKERVI